MTSANRGKKGSNKSHKRKVGRECPELKRISRPTPEKNESAKMQHQNRLDVTLGGRERMDYRQRRTKHGERMKIETGLTAWGVSKKRRTKKKKKTTFKRGPGFGAAASSEDKTIGKGTEKKRRAQRGEGGVESKKRTPTGPESQRGLTHESMNQGKG